MRMRKKPNLLPRMEKTASTLISAPEEYCGKWRESFPDYKEIHLELGCGKGRFTADTAQNNPDVFLVALEKVPDAMVVGMERVCGRGIGNVRFIDRDAVLLPMIFQPGEVDRVYVNFCDPWPKSRDAKHRLTAPGFLRIYASILAVGGQLHFKTDNLPLFQWSAEKLAEEGWDLSQVTNDLHEHGVQGVMTDYEAKFHARGVKINRLAATRTEKTKTLADGPVERLRNASLSDARGRQEIQG